MLLDCHHLQPAATLELSSLATRTAASNGHLMINEALLHAHHTLYQRVNATILHSEGVPSDVLSTLLKHLQTIAPGVQLKRQPLGHHNPDIVALECLWQLMLGETLSPVDVQRAYRDHYTLCWRYCADQLARIAHQDLNTYQAISRSCEQLGKYHQLKALRQRYPVMTDYTSLADLKALQQLDAQQKYLIYQTSLSLPQALQTLSLATLAQCIISLTISTTQSLLQSVCESRYQALQQWESDLNEHIQNAQQSWLGYAKWLGQQAWDRFYQASFIGVGAQLFDWLGERLSSLRFPLSPTSQDLSSRQTRPSKRWLRWLGGGLGLLYSYSLGSYALLRTVVINVFSLLLSDRLQARLLQEEQATVRTPPRYYPTAATLTRLLHLSLATAESTYTGNYRSLLQALGGTLGSLGLPRLAQYGAPHLVPVDPATLTSDQWFAVFCLALIGYQLGQSAADYPAHWLEKQTLRATFEQAFRELAQQHHYLGPQLHFIQSYASLTFWQSTTDQATLSWTCDTRQGHTFYEMACDLRALSATDYIADCEATTLTHTLRLKAD